MKHLFIRGKRTSKNEIPAVKKTRAEAVVVPSFLASVFPGDTIVFRGTPSPSRILEKQAFFNEMASWSSFVCHILAVNNLDCRFVVLVVVVVVVVVVVPEEKPTKAHACITWSRIDCVDNLCPRQRMTCALRVV